MNCLYRFRPPHLPLPHFTSSFFPDPPFPSHQVLFAALRTMQLFVSLEGVDERAVDVDISTIASNTCVVSELKRVIAEDFEALDPECFDLVVDGVVLSETSDVLQLSCDDRVALVPSEAHVAAQQIRDSGHALTWSGYKAAAAREGPPDMCMRYFTAAKLFLPPDSKVSHALVMAMCPHTDHEKLHAFGRAGVDGSESLRRAVEIGVVPAINFLLDNGYAKVDEPFDTDGAPGSTPLLAAINTQRLSTIKALVEHGADVNGVCCPPALTALEMATKRTWCTAMNPEQVCAIVEYLLQHGADPNISVNRKSTAVIYAASIGNLKALTMLVGVGKGNVNARGRRGATALMRAAVNGNPDCAKYLIEQGAELDVTDQYHATALVKAASQNHHSIVEALLDAGATVSSEKCMSAMAHAGRTRGAAKTVRLLLKAGANPDEAVAWAKGKIPRSRSRARKRLRDVQWEIEAHLRDACAPKRP